MAYYLNPGMLAKQYETIASYPDLIKKRLEYIVVDDGSPHSPAASVQRSPGLPELKIFRIKVDVRWNMDAARNIGVKEASAKWLLLTDVDHFIPVNTMNAAVFQPLDANRVYRFARVSAPDMLPHHAHPNSWLMSRNLYKRVGGYDERFAGYYGTDDDFRDRIMQVCAIVNLSWHLIRLPCELIPDASTTTAQGALRPAQQREVAPGARRQS
jgi:glycosyltransferase involved in cell wall biosynthesis